MPCDFDFDRLIEQYRKPMSAAAFHLCGDKDAAQDIVQETLLAAYRGRKSLRDPRKAGAWLYTILRRKAIDHRRSRRSEAELRDDICAPQADELESLTRQIVIDQLEQLSQDDRQILAGKYLLGLTYRDLSESMGLHEGTIRARCFRAKERLRRALRGTVLTDR